MHRVRADHIRNAILARARLDKLLGLEAARKLELSASAKVDPIEERRRVIAAIIGNPGPHPILEVLSSLADSPEEEPLSRSG